MKLVDMAHFSYRHLPVGLHEISKLYQDLAYSISNGLSDGIEKQFCLRNLLLSKDCAIRVYEEMVEGKTV